MIGISPGCWTCCTTRPQGMSQPIFEKTYFFDQKEPSFINVATRPSPRPASTTSSRLLSSPSQSLRVQAKKRIKQQSRQPKKSPLNTRLPTFHRRPGEIGFPKCDESKTESYRRDQSSQFSRSGATPACRRRVDPLRFRLAEPHSPKAAVTSTVDPTGI